MRVMIDFQLFMWLVCKKRLVALYLLGCLVGHSGNLSMVVDEKVEEKEHGDSKPENMA